MRNVQTKKTALYTAIVTPFRFNGEIAFAEMEKLLLDQERAGNGIVVLGSTGEGLALTEEERKKIVSFTSDLRLQVPVLVGVSGFQLPQTLEFLRFCEGQEGIDGYLMPVPLYAKPGSQGQQEWFMSMLQAVKRPCMIYNVPSRAGVKLAPEALKAISAHPNAWAVKEASGSLTEFSAYRAAAPAMAFFSGDDALLPEFVKLGAVGLVSVASNAWPEATQRYVQLCLGGKAAATQPLWQEASDSLFVASNPVPVKALLKLQGRIDLVRVRAPLSERDLVSTSQLEDMDQKINQWHASL